jgi:hypothetical protein
MLIKNREHEQELDKIQLEIFIHELLKKNFGELDMIGIMPNLINYNQNDSLIVLQLNNKYTIF